MRKSDKKVTSDRVYALRKRYDAFLEEDKVRKERNEFILGKLDKMRSSNALVPSRNKDIFLASILFNRDERPLKEPVTSKEGFSTTPESCDFSLSCVTSYIGEKILLQEMCKKYIMIPKGYKNNDDFLKQNRLAENGSEKVMKMKDIDGSTCDWKKKYDILDKLKRDKVESDMNTTETLILKNEREHIVHNIMLNNILENHHTEEDTDKNKCFEQELPVRDNIDYTITQLPDHAHISYEEPRNLLLNNNLDINTENENKAEIQNNTFNIREETHENRSGNYNEPQQNEVTQYINGTELGYNLTHTNAEDKNINKGIMNINREETTGISDGFYNEQQLIDEKPNINGTESGYDQTHAVILDYKNPEKKEEDKDGKVILTSSDINAINSCLIVESNKGTGQQYEYPIDPGQTQEFLPERGDVLRDSVNINPIAYNTTQVFVTGQDQSEYGTEYLHVSNSEQGENPVNNEEYVKNSENIAFVEHIQPSDIMGGDIQRQNSYQPEFEPLVVNDENVIAVSENSDYLVDSSQIEEFNAEQNNMFYSEQTENVELDNQYTETTQRPYVDDYAAVYYEGTQQPIDINEHEETNQFYDQSYEQQYYEQPKQDYNQLAHEQPKGVAYEQMPQTDEPGTYGQGQDNYNQSQENYEQLQQNYERLHYDEKNYGNPNDVEQQLDRDQYLVEQKPLVDDVIIQPSKVVKEELTPNLKEIPDINKT